MTISPPGGGRPKPRKFTISNTKKAKFSFPLPQVTKIGNTLSVEILLVATGGYCSALEKSWAGSWNKYTKRYRAQHSQLRKVKAVTHPQVIIESKSLENTV